MPTAIITSPARTHRIGVLNFDRHKQGQIAIERSNANPPGDVIFVKYSGLRVILRSLNRPLKKGKSVPMKITNVNNRNSQLFQTKKRWTDGENEIREIPKRRIFKRDWGLKPPGTLGFGKAYQIVKGPLSGA